ncbi:MAG: hypothetical protein ACOYMG_05880, partial [Candidatus Methylumidiphilus sp.]
SAGVFLGHGRGLGILLQPLGAGLPNLAHVHQGQAHCRAHHRLGSDSAGHEPLARAFPITG